MTSTSSIPIPDLASESITPLQSTESTTHNLPTPFHLTTPTPQLLTQGAEALIYRTTHLQPSQPAALKFRPSKPYRHPTLDNRLTKQRVLAEARVLVKLSGLREQGVCVPAVLALEWDVGRKMRRGYEGDIVRKTEGDVAAAAGVREQGQGAWILMEWIEGVSVKELLRRWDGWVKGLAGSDEEKKEVIAKSEGDVKALLRRAGRAVAAMHAKGGVVHGDLTSSNIMVRPVDSEKVAGERDGEGGDATSTTMTAAESGVGGDDGGDTSSPPDLEGEIVLIDFGLAVQSVQDEDRAVDLYVLERAFGSTHPRQEGWFDQEVLQSQEGYRGAFKGSGVVLKRLEEVRMRGRKRSMIG